jgi:DNA gyrase inhibitor GyrI
MGELEVRIVKLEPIHIASAHALSASPEGEAFEKLVAWAQPKGLTDDLKTHRIFGFNNPSPTPGSPNYGYEFWMVVGPEVEPEGEIKIKDFDGGLYAVTRCTGVENIHPTWQKLVTWLEDSKHQGGSHQWLEEHLSPIGTPMDELVIDLYAPIIE